MKKNNSYFIKMWMKSLIIVIPIVFILTFDIYRNITNGNVHNVILNILSIVFGIGITYFIRSKSKRKINKGFQCKTSIELLRYFDSIYSKRALNLSDKDAYLTYSKCIICCYYGEFDKVTQMLTEINWDARTPYIQSLEFTIKSTMCYLQSENYKEGLRLSILSKQLGSMSNAIPGSNKTQNFYETYVQVGELLNGSIDNNIIESLEGKYKESPILVKPLMAYCLSKVYIKLNMPEKAKEKIQYCKQVIPHCKPLIERYSS